jgi:YggT family protein
MRALFWLLDTAISLYIWALIIAAVLSLLLAFNVLDTRNRFVWTVADFFYRVTEPLLRPIRRRMPNLGGVDLSPLVLILLLSALRILLTEIQVGLMRSGVGW